jgi:radical SAM-linked protein
MRIRLRYTCLGKIRFLSHRDMARVWERALRRLELPVAYSEGFSPRPKLHFGLALSTGHESLAEYLEVGLVGDAAIDLDTLAARLTGVLPAGLDCVAVAPVEPGARSLQEAVTSCTWQIDASGLDAVEAATAVAAALAAPTLPIERERKGRPIRDDVRPALLDLHLEGVVVDALEESLVRLRTELATQPRGVRPRELLTVLHPALEERRVVRLHQWTTPDGARREEPLARDATRAPHAEVRV